MKKTASVVCLALLVFAKTALADEFEVQMKCDKEERAIAAGKMKGYSKKCKEYFAFKENQARKEALAKMKAGLIDDQIEADEALARIGIHRKPATH